MDFSIEWHDRVGSTNAVLREACLRGKQVADGTVIAASEQTAGRGRQDRKWLSRPDTNLCFSIFLETSAELIRTPSLTMAAALAVAELLQTKGIRARPKWPNDVLVGERKICGILSERIEKKSPDGTGIIVGVGLNVNMSLDEAAAIDRPATSMMIESGRAYDLKAVLADLLPLIEFWADRWKNGGFDGIRSEWTERAGPIGRTVSVHDGDIRKTGTLAGFGPHGELLMQTAKGIETIWTGDVS